MNYKLKGILLIAAGAILFSSKAIAIKLAYTHLDVDDLTLLTLRFSLSLPIFMAVVLFRWKSGKLKGIHKRDWWFLAFLSMLGYYIASWLDFRGLQYITAGLERIVLFLYPTFVAVFSWLIFKKSLSKKALIALLISYLGVVIIAFDPLILKMPNLLLGGSLILISAITYALYLVFGGELIQKIGSVNFNALAMVFSCIYVLIHYFIASPEGLIFNSSLWQTGIYLAIFCTVIPTFMVMEGIRILGANMGSMVASIGPVSTIVLGYFILNEQVTFQELVGSFFIILGVFLISK